jgi:uncharacterized membrane protein YbhN (UPF0104 family)
VDADPTQPTPAEGSAYLRSPVVQGLIGVVVLVVAFAWALPSFASYGEVWAELRRLEAPFGLAIAAVGAANLIAPSTAQRAALPGLSLPVAVTVDWVTSAVTNTVPGGSAAAMGLTWSMYRNHGLAPGPIARSLVVTGLWDLFVKLATPLVAVAWLSTQQPIGPGLVQAAAVGTVLFAAFVVLATLVLARARTVDAMGRLLGRLPFVGDGVGPLLARLRHDTIQLLRHRGASLTVWTVAGHANLYLLLVVCTRAVGITSSELTWAAVLAAFAFGRLVTALPLTPGGLGVMEVSLTTGLAQVGGADPAAVVAAVLLFRFVSLVLPIPLGALAWLGWSGRRAVASGATSERRR